MLTSSWVGLGNKATSSSVLFNCTLASWHGVLGAVWSCTLIVAVQLAVFPLGSVTASVTELSPTDEQSKALNSSVFVLVMLQK